MVDVEKRRYARQHREAVIQLLIWPDDHRESGKDETFIPVHMANVSEDGVYFELERALPAGSAVSLKMSAPGDASAGDAYYMNHGRVRWCRALKGSEGRFGIGVKIVEQVVQADVRSPHFHRLA